MNIFLKQHKTLLSFFVLLLAFSFTTLAQPGGLDVFKPANPTVQKKPSSTGNKPKPKPKPNSKKPKLTPEEIEAKYEESLDAGNIARDERRYTDAEKAYREGVQVKVKDFRAHYGLGNVYADQQRWEDAEKAYRDASVQDFNNVDINTALSFVLVKQKGNAKKLADAEAAARRAITIDPNNAVAFDRLGVAIDLRGGSKADAEDAFRKSTELDPNFALAYAHLGRMQALNNKRKDSQNSYKRAVELAQDAPTFALIAEAYQSDQRYEESILFLQKALELDDKYPPALHLLGTAYVATRKYTEAESTLQRAIAASPKTFASHYLLGSLYQRMDRIEDAEGSYNRAAEVANASDKKQLAGAYGFIGLGDAYLKAGRSKDAVRVYQKAQTLDPTNQEVKSKIAEARGN